MDTTTKKPPKHKDNGPVAPCVICLAPRPGIMFCKPCAKSYDRFGGGDCSIAAAISWAADAARFFSDCETELDGRVAYIYQGAIETSSGRWVRGYTAIDGQQPYMTKAQCRAEARRYGRAAVFFEDEAERHRKHWKEIFGQKL